MGSHTSNSNETSWTKSHDASRMDNVKGSWQNWKPFRTQLNNSEDHCAMTQTMASVCFERHSWLLQTLSSFWNLNCNCVAFPLAPPPNTKTEGDIWRTERHPITKKNVMYKVHQLRVFSDIHATLINIATMLLATCNGPSHSLPTRHSNWSW